MLSLYNNATHISSTNIGLTSLLLLPPWSTIEAPGDWYALMVVSHTRSDWGKRRESITAEKKQKSSISPKINSSSRMMLCLCNDRMQSLNRKSDKGHGKWLDVTMKLIVLWGKMDSLWSFILCKRDRLASLICHARHLSSNFFMRLLEVSSME